MHSFDNFTAQLRHNDEENVELPPPANVTMTVPETRATLSTTITTATVTTNTTSTTDTSAQGSNAVRRRRPNNSAMGQYFVVNLIS